MPLSASGSCTADSALSAEIGMRHACHCICSLSALCVSVTRYQFLAVAMGYKLQGLFLCPGGSSGVTVSCDLLAGYVGRVW